MARHSRRYDRVAGNYSQYRPRYPDRLVAHLAGIIGTAPAVSGASIVLDVGSGTGAFTRRLRAALPSETRIVGIEPSPVMRAQAIAETAHADALAFVDGAAEAIPVGDNAAGAVVAATAAHWFDRPQFYADAHRVLMPGGVLAIVAYVRDEARSPLAAALVAFIARHGSPRAYAPTDYRQELVGRVRLRRHRGFCAAPSPPARHRRVCRAGAVVLARRGGSSSASVARAPGMRCATSRRPTASTTATCVSATSFNASPCAAIPDITRPVAAPRPGFFLLRIRQCPSISLPVPGSKRASGVSFGAR
jgi:ubiquinone/menaquinone biosynthesis C-methylase UbiE